MRFNVNGKRGRTPFMRAKLWNGGTEIQVLRLENHKGFSYLAVEISRFETCNSDLFRLKSLGNYYFAFLADLSATLKPHFNA